jgi:chemotaxis protein MotB
MSQMPNKRGPFRFASDDEDHGDELWIMSYADMVTLLFGFFVILYSFSTVDDKKFDQMSEKLAEAFKSEKTTERPEEGISNEARRVRALQMLVSMLNLGETVEEALPKIEHSYIDAKAQKSISDQVLNGVASKHIQTIAGVKKHTSKEFQTIELVLPSHLLFPSGGYRLSKKSASSLQDLALDIRNIEGLHEIEVVGHTDSSSPGKNEVYQSNFELSALRAGAVASVLSTFGVEEKKIRVQGVGSAQPLLDEVDAAGKAIPENKAKNRRVGILLKVRNKSAQTSH